MRLTILEKTEHLPLVYRVIWMRSDRNRTAQEDKICLNTVYFGKCCWSCWKLLKEHHIFSCRRWTSRETAFGKPAFCNIFRQWIWCIQWLLGRNWKVGPFTFFFLLCSNSFPTSQVSYWRWPTGQVTVPHLQQSRRQLDCSFSSPCW